MKTTNTTTRLNLEFLNTTKRLNWNSKRRYTASTQFKFL